MEVTILALYCKPIEKSDFLIINIYKMINFVNNETLPIAIIFDRDTQIEYSTLLNSIIQYFEKDMSGISHIDDYLSQQSSMSRLAQLCYEYWLCKEHITNAESNTSVGFCEFFDRSQMNNIKIEASMLLANEQNCDLVPLLYLSPTQSAAIVQSNSIIVQVLSLIQEVCFVFIYLFIYS